MGSTALFLLGVRLYGRNSAAGASDCTTTGGNTHLAVQLRLGLLSERAAGSSVGSSNCITACRGIAILNLATGSKA